MEQNEVFKQYRPLIDSTVSAYSGNVPADLVRLEAEIIVAKAIGSFDPTKGTMGTHLKTHLKQMNRVINEASPIYIPESRAFKYNKFLTVREELEKSLKRPPTHNEMAQSMQMDIRDIKRLSVETNKKLITDSSIPDAYSIGYDPSFNKDRALEQIYSNLTDPNSRKILEHTFGMHGKPILPTNKALAGATHLSESGVRKKKDQIITLIRDFING